MSPASPPFFIVGHPRSGTTLLRFMLSSHPRLYIPEETGFIPYLMPRRLHRRPLSLAQTRRLLERIARLNYLWAGLADDLPAFYASLPQPTLSAVLDALYRRMVAPHGAERWGDKTPLYVQHIPLLAGLFPGAQFIHIIRDGRDAALSARKKWGYAYQDLTYLLRHWVRNVRTGQRNGRALGQTRYLEIRYETLVRQPQTTLEAVCRFLGEAFHPRMLRHTDLARQVGPGPDNHTEILRPVSTASIGRWRREMSPFQKKIAVYIAGDLLAELGYDLPPLPPFTPAERARVLALDARFAAVDSLRTGLYRLGILTLNRTMRRPPAPPPR